MSNIGERIRDVRVEKGLSQRELARRVGISQSTLSDLERGEITGRSLEILASMARIFGVSADYLLFLGENEVRYPSIPGLTPGEAQLIDLVRQMSPERKRMLLAMAQLLREEDERRRRYDQLLTAIETLDAAGMLEQSQERLLVLSGELGSFRAAITALAAELGLTEEVAEEPFEEA